MAGSVRSDVTSESSYHQMGVQSRTWAVQVGRGGILSTNVVRGAGTGERNRRLVAAEAAEWLDRLSSDDLSVSDRAEFVDWLRESPVHVAETLRIERLRAIQRKSVRNQSG